MKPRELTERDVEFRLEVEQDDLRVRGNAMASGDDAADKEVEDEILRRLDNGDVWAWASVRVVATWNGIEGDDHLGACSYEDEADFKACAYFADMKAEALRNLNETLARRWDELSALVES